MQAVSSDMARTVLPVGLGGVGSLRAQSDQSPKGRQVLRTSVRGEVREDAPIVLTPSPVRIKSAPDGDWAIEDEFQVHKGQEEEDKQTLSGTDVRPTKVCPSSS